MATMLDSLGLFDGFLRYHLGIVRQLFSLFHCVFSVFSKAPKDYPDGDRVGQLRSF